MDRRQREPGRRDRETPEGGGGEPGGAAAEAAEEGRRRLAAADDAIDRAHSGDAAAFMLDNRQSGGQ